MVPIAWVLVDWDIALVWLCCLGYHQYYPCRICGLRCGFHRNICRARQWHLHWQGLFLHSRVAWIECPLSLLHQVYIPGLCCIVPFPVDNQWPVDQFFWGPCSNRGCCGPWIPRLGLLFLWVSGTNIVDCAWHLEILDRIWGSFVWLWWISGNGILLVFAVLVSLYHQYVWLGGRIDRVLLLSQFVMHLFQVQIGNLGLVWQVLEHWWWG